MVLKGCYIICFIIHALCVCVYMCVPRRSIITSFATHTHIPLSSSHTTTDAHNVGSVQKAEAKASKIKKQNQIKCANEIVLLLLLSFFVFTLRMVGILFFDSFLFVFFVLCRGKPRKGSLLRMRRQYVCVCVLQALFELDLCVMVCKVCLLSIFFLYSHVYTHTRTHNTTHRDTHILEY